LLRCPCHICCAAPIGDNAEIGKINKLVSQVEQVKTNLIIQMEILGRWLAIVVLVIALGAFLLALLRAKEPFTHAFESAVAIAVAMIPEGLPALVTIVLALGTTKMAEHQAAALRRGEQALCWLPKRGLLSCGLQLRSTASGTRRVWSKCCCRNMAA
jgi:cation transport ATPase